MNVLGAAGGSATISRCIPCRPVSLHKQRASRATPGLHGRPSCNDMAANKQKKPPRRWPQEKAPASDARPTCCAGDALGAGGCTSCKHGKLLSTRGQPLKKIWGCMESASDVGQKKSPKHQGPSQRRTHGLHDRAGARNASSLLSTALSARTAARARCMGKLKLVR
jgi:hypothetical protein